LSCKFLNASRIIRHDRIVQVIARVARLSGVTVHLEPRIDGEDRSRGDGHLFFHAQSAIFDTLVIDPCAKSYVKGAQFLLGAATTVKPENPTFMEKDADNKITFSSQWFWSLSVEWVFAVEI
jgi:hypothetical protein